MKKILFVAYKFFDEDPRIVREAASCIRNGYKVDVVCVGRPKGEFVKPPEGVTIYSPKIERKRASRLRYLFEYMYFFIYAFFLSTVLHIRRKYSIVQVFVMPEFLVFSAILPRMLGAKILMDWEDPSLEVFHTKYPQRNRFFSDFVLKNIEKVAARFSHKVITPNIGFNKAFKKRGIDITKFDVVMNAPDSVIFSGVQKASPRVIKDHYSILYNGTVFERHGLHVAIEAVAKVKERIPSVNLYIVGDGECGYMNRCKDMVDQYDLRQNVTFIPRVQIEEIPSIIFSASAGVVPNISTPFTEINLPQRILEFGFLRKPMIIPRLAGILDYISEDEALFFSPGNVEELAESMLVLYNEPETVKGKIDALFEKCRGFDWERAYIDTLAELSCNDKRPSVQQNGRVC